MEFLIGKGNICKCEIQQTQFILLYNHSSLVDYLAQVMNAKNFPTTFYCIFQLVWVPTYVHHEKYQGMFP